MLESSESGVTRLKKSAQLGSLEVNSAAGGFCSWLKQDKIRQMHS